MKKLSKKQFEKAKEYMKTQAEEIDLAMFEYYFEEKPLNEVINVLASYQNDDGGFGKLDYDFECPYSCLKHTESACRYIFDLEKIPCDNPMIKKLLPYIVKNYNKVNGKWNNLMVPEVNDYPHAPWWGYENSDKESEDYIPKDRTDLIDNYDANTNSALAGMLAKYSLLVPKDILNMAMGVAIDKINSGHDFYQYEMMSNIYFVNALNDESLKNELLKTLMGNGKLISILDGDWNTENAMKLSHWIDSPNHPYYYLYKDAIQKNLLFLIDAQQQDGSWLPNWSWGEPDVWKRVIKKIKGELTVKFLWTLKKFDCFDNFAY